MTVVGRTLSEDDLIRIYRDTLRPLYGFVSRRVGGDAALAEDLVQDTWMRALDTWPTRGVPDDPAAWLMRVARNTLISHFRRVRPELIDPAHLDIEDERFSPEAPDTATVVGWGLARLRRQHADVLEDFYFEGRTVAEIAARRAVSERSIEGKLRRARQRLKQKLSKVMRRD
jgi:RNA polymerase sigma-70 factor (ECF subfamily)